MKIVKSFFIAFSIYSKIPVPQFQWKEEDMKYCLCFFPWVGVVIGVCVFLWRVICEKWGIGVLCSTLIGTAIPILITGGFHIDGYMDTMDAFHSYQSKERKIEILKDSHIGAFAVIMLGVYGLIYMGAFSEIQDKRLLQIVCIGFVLSRCLSGIGAVSFPLAKKDGLLFLFADSAQKNIVKGALCLQSAICVGLMLQRVFYAGIVVSITAFGIFGYYYYHCKKELGGVTGDTAGCFVLLCEGGIMTVAAVWNIFI